MKDVSITELKQIQLEILKEVHLFCSRHNLNYSLAYGTLLGAIRHKGFIPWDDDIDIMMPREDYNKFIKTFSHEQYKVLSAPITKGYYLTYAKIVDLRTDLVEFCAQKLHMGVNIDIFPLDNCISDEKIINEWWVKKKKITRLYNFKLLPVSLKIGYRTFLYKLFYEIMYPFQTLKKLGLYIQSMATIFNNEDADKIGILSSPWFTLQKLYPKSILDNYIDVEFENSTFRCFKEYETILTVNYGDWRKLPPLEERKTHHTFKAYWKE